MAERTMLKQLSGSEIIEAVLDTLRTKMTRDCYLNPNNAYDFFEARIKVELDMHDTGSLVKSDHEIKILHGDRPEEEDIEVVVDSVTIPAAAPNDVRQSTGQPIPVLTTDANGRQVEKSVHYARKSSKAATTRARAVALLFALVCVGMAHGQAPQSDPAVASPVAPVAAGAQLTATEHIAVEAIVEKNQDILKRKAEIDKAEKELRGAIQAVELDIQRSHPGMRLDERTGELVPQVATPHPAPGTPKK
jgi:hypothetical protein